VDAEGMMEAGVGVSEGVVGAFLGDEEDGIDVDDMVCDGGAHDEATNRFDSMMGALEGMVISDEFGAMQDAFCRAKCGMFVEEEENRVEYMPIYEDWVATLEGHLADALAERGGDMGEFVGMLVEKCERERDVLEGDVFDLLMSMIDFEAFKEMMLSYKRGMEMEAEGGAADGSFMLEVTQLKVHTEEMSDGEERPDLDFSLDITAL